MSEFDFDFDFTEDEQPKNNKKKQFVCDVCGKPQFKADSFVTRRTNNIYRNAYSELNLFDVMPAVFNKNDVVFINIIMLNVTKNYFNNYILSKFAKV